ncbi:MAG: ABC transporter substrate-binding protein [Desulfovibrionales bacterium]
MNRALLCLIALALVVVAGCGQEENTVQDTARSEASKADVLVGVISDLSGGTSTVGRPYADGVKAAAGYINDNGGIAGHKLKLHQVDYAYNVQQALSAYKRFKSMGVVAIQGWGTGDTEALVETVAKDRIPFYSASYSAHLADPKRAPYNFFITADYSTQLRGGLDFLNSQWKEERAPRIGFVYPDHPYGLAPIAAGKEYAGELGFEIVGDETVSLNAMDATTQLLALQKKEPDFIWVGGTTPSTAVIMKDAKKLKMTATFLSNIWGSDEDIFKLAGDAANGHYGLQGSVVYGQDVPGMKIIEEITGGEPQMIHYIRGFASMLTMAEAMRIAAEKGEITGPAIKEASETLRDYDPMGLAPPVSFYPDDHRPNLAVNMVLLDNGQLNFVSTQTLPRKDEWLGK